jgi:hypothetical protein
MFRNSCTSRTILGIIICALPLLSLAFAVTLHRLAFIEIDHSNSILSGKLRENGSIASMINNNNKLAEVEAAAVIREWKEIALVTTATGGFDASPLIASATSAGGMKSDLAYIFGDSCTPLEPLLTLNVSRKNFINMDKEDHNFLPTQYKKKKKKKQLQQVHGNNEDEQQQQMQQQPHHHRRRLHIHRSKLKKAQIFSYITSTSINRVIFCDADVEINTPLQTFLVKQVGRWDASCSAYMFNERYYSEHTFNSGIILLDRTYSRDFLGEYGRGMADSIADADGGGSSRIEKDQDVLETLLQTFR